MANVVVTTPNGFNPYYFNNIVPETLVLIDTETVTVHVDLESGYTIRFVGTDLVIDMDMLNPFISGTVTAVYIEHLENDENGVTTVEDVAITGISVDLADLGGLLVADPSSVEYGYSIMRFLMSGNDSYLGSNGQDVILTGLGNDTVEAGGGIDLIFVGPGAATIDGGDGEDTLNLNNIFSGNPTAAAGVNIDLAALKGTNSDGSALVISGIEHVNGGVGNDTITGNALDNILGGNAGDDFIKGGDGDDILLGDEGNDTLDGGAGDDLFYIGETSQTAFYTGNKVLIGGAGRDQAILNGELSEYTYRFDDAGQLVFTHKASGATYALSGIETIFDGIVERSVDDFRPVVTPSNTAPTSLTLTSGWVWENTNGNKPVGVLGAKDVDGDKLTYSLVDDARGRFKIDGNKLVVAEGANLDYEQAKSHIVIVQVSDGRGGASTQTFTISVRDVAKENVTGGTGADIVKGGSGSDKIGGGLGKDVLTGGKGKDAFVFNTKASKTNVDKITDFNVKDDSIYLDNAMFSKLGKKGSLSSPAKLNKDFFVTGSKAKDKNDYLVYDSKKGVLSYDADGSGKGKAVEIATLSNKAKLTDADFFVI
ncbi:Ca2+-binding RTX toxin-like protein [Microvirga lupini]|uniref:Ca2+-binding RTX toxin-like protein n=1 Tax=Microvirga lupini TaxID=420324 RepID=A0A7W4VPV8_9HYPH|nr:calcium-binding protein [Microvirga lupini]MBB3021153.1 Ca2+-binding RTX toxin-like protein [Microvirga lupini]